MKESPIHGTSWNHLQVGTRFLQAIAKWASKQHRTTIRTWRSWCQSCIRILEGFETKPSVQNDAKCKRACLSRQFKLICTELHLHTCLAFFLARNSWTRPTWYSKIATASLAPSNESSGPSVFERGGDMRHKT